MLLDKVQAAFVQTTKLPQQKKLARTSCPLLVHKDSAKDGPPPPPQIMHIDSSLYTLNYCESEVAVHSLSMQAFLAVNNIIISSTGHIVLHEVH